MTAPYVAGLLLPAIPTEDQKILIARVGGGRAPGPCSSRSSTFLLRSRPTPGVLPKNESHHVQWYIKDDTVLGCGEDHDVCGYSRTPT